MYLKNLQIFYTGPFTDLNLKFGTNATVIIGENGVGKTTIIESIIAVWNSEININQDIYPKTKYGFDKSTINCEIFNDGNKYQKNISYCWNVGSDEFKKDPIANNERMYVPLIAISPYRKFQKRNINGPTKEGASNKSQLGNIFANNFMNDNSNFEIQNWIVNRYFFSKENWGESYKRELNYFVKQLNNFFPEGSIFKFDSVNNLMEPLFKTNSGIVPFHILSSGIQSISYIIFQIIQALSKYYDESNNIFYNKGLVLIDEIEVHLHPTWQKFILKGLKNMFPNCQFIVSTHSPLVLSGCEDGEVVALIRENDSTRVEYPDKISGWLAEDILNDYMGVKTSRSEKMEKNIQEYKSLYKKKYKESINRSELKKLSNLKNTLENALPESDPITSMLMLEVLNEEIEKNDEENR